MALILASQSAHRAKLLQTLGVPFTVQPAHIDETPLPHEAPLAYVKRIACAKAAAVSAKNPGSVVLAADTPVIVGRRILQTPQTGAEATAMLKLQSGRRVSIPTVVAMADAQGKIHSKTALSWVKFKRLTDHEIAAYVASGAWQRVSGAIQLETHAEPWIATLHGSWSGIIGLPLYQTTLLLQKAGIKVNPHA